MQDLRNALYQHLQFMPLRFFTTTRTGEIQSRLANDVGGVQSVVTTTAASLLVERRDHREHARSRCSILSWQLTVLSLCITPIFVWLTVKVGRARREVATNTQKTLADLTAITEETLSASAGSCCRSRSVASDTRSTGIARRTSGSRTSRSVRR